ncbi:DUF1772 domain-containing protein [uncultured Eudoraea sp.]|uniref:anthrone oxygenase family protein n=1 Tax=uncultured Eudoraea sp. TaxID=1035614 RepID=UPI002601E29D|nr:DUF1772 domain-containing protein [uncultured Eudoraea sp.]
MTSLNFDTQTIVLVLATLLTGLTAGLCFTWNNAVTPGVGQLVDMGYLRSFQEMNRAIINPIFLIVFFGPFFLHIANIFLFKTSSGAILWLVMVSAALYIIGLVAVTIFGNVPLNELLDKTDLMQASAEELKLLRDKFEVKWNRFHLIRTVSTVLSFLLLIIICLSRINTINT